MILSFRADRSGQNSADPVQTAPKIRVYTVCHSVCIFWTHYSRVKPLYSDFRVITTYFSDVRIFRSFTVNPEFDLYIITFPSQESVRRVDVKDGRPP